MLSKIDEEILRHIDKFGFITIQQCSNMFFNTKYGYDSARRKLNKMYENKLIKHVDIQYNSKIKIYYNKKKPSVHKIMLLNFYSMLIATNIEILQFETEFKASNIVADGFCIFRYNNIAKAILIEVDLWNKTKSNKYIECFNSSMFQESLGAFPIVTVLDKDIKRKKKEDSSQPYIIIRGNLESVVKKII